MTDTDKHERLTLGILHSEFFSHYGLGIRHCFFRWFDVVLSFNLHSLWGLSTLSKATQNPKGIPAESPGLRGRNPVRIVDPRHEKVPPSIFIRCILAPYLTELPALHYRFNCR